MNRQLVDAIELAAIERRRWDQLDRQLRAGGDPVAMAGTQYYHDARPPFATAIYPTITLLSTSKMLVPANPNMLVQPTDWYAGKKFRLYCVGKFTTALTPGNLTIELRVGTTDAGGTIIATSSAIALTASKTDITWEFEGLVTCLSTGSGGASGSMIGTGRFTSNQLGLLIPAANNPLMIPETLPAPTTVDLQAATGVSLQMKRSGSTAETVTVCDQVFSALN